jgi:cytochrome c peroxidase
MTPIQRFVSVLSLCGQRCGILLLLACHASADEPLPNTKIEALPRSAALPTDTPAKVELGRLLFFDPILSATRYVACATCHHPKFGWADARPTPLGMHASGIGPQRRLVKAAEFQPLRRNTPTILNAAFNGIESDKPFDPQAAPMFWDNRVQSLEAQALVPVRQREEMRGDVCSEAEAVPEMIERLKSIPEYRQRFEGKITANKVADAIAAFERAIHAWHLFWRYRASVAGAVVRVRRIFSWRQSGGCLLSGAKAFLPSPALHKKSPRAATRGFQVGSDSGIRN